VDVELTVLCPHGPRSWGVVITRAHGMKANSSALLRLAVPQELHVGERLRVLEGAIARDLERADSPLIVTLSTFSEAYRVTAPPSTK